jgi:predicted membrane channel-forming protein YqfA (hemolysin III family)
MHKIIKEDFIMKLNAPKKITFIIGVVFILVGLVGVLVDSLGFLHTYGYWFTLFGGVWLALGCMIKGM